MATRTVPRTNQSRNASAGRGRASSGPVRASGRGKAQGGASSQRALQVLRDVLTWSESQESEEPRSLFTVAFAPTGILLGLVSVVSLVTLVSANSDLEGAFGAIALVWLAVHQVPVSIADTVLGALPILPTGLVVLLVARCSAQAASTRPTKGELRQVLAAAMGGPLLITMILLATAKDAATVVPINAPDPAPALAWVTGVHLSASLGGMLWARRADWAHMLPDWAPQALRLGLRGGLWLFAASGAMLTLNMIVHWNRLAAGFGRDPGIVGLVGILLLSALYLPNLMVAGMDVLVGATVQLGATSVNLDQAKIGPMPMLPIFSPLVSWQFGKAAFAGLALAVLVGVWLGGESARKGQAVGLAARAAAASAACTAVLVAFCSAVVSGKVGAIGSWSVNLLVVWAGAFVLLAGGAVAAVLAKSAPSALHGKPAPVVVISPAREQADWEEQASAEESEAENPEAEEEPDSAEELCVEEEPGAEAETAAEAEAGTAAEAGSAQEEGSGARESEEVEPEADGGKRSE